MNIEGYFFKGFIRRINMDQNAKIVFIHSGDNWYLPYVLHQAKHVSPDSEVVLLGQLSNSTSIQNVTLEKLREPNSIKEFNKIYVHMSTNPKDFELFCFTRWHYLLEYMHLSKTRSIFYFDSDVLLYSPIKDIAEIYGRQISACAYLIIKQDVSSMRWSATAHASYWTLDFLEKFCNFTRECFCQDKYLNMLKQKWAWHVTNDKPGGICDMTVLFLFWLENSGNIANLAINYNNNVFDDNINSSANYEENEYLMHRRWKKIKFINKEPMLIKADNKKNLVRAHALHFQGTAKRYIPLYCSEEKFKNRLFYLLNHINSSCIQQRLIVNIRNFVPAPLRRWLKKFIYR